MAMHMTNKQPQNASQSEKREHKQGDKSRTVEIKGSVKALKALDKIFDKLAKC